MSLAGPPPVSTNPFLRLALDFKRERDAPVPFPPGDTGFSLHRTQAFSHNPLPMLLDLYERYGPVFTVRIFHGNVVFMLGPEANHHITVSHADNFTWRDGHMGDMMPLLGDGLLTIDGDFHRRSRRIMLPAFHRERVAGALGTMREEIDAALEPWSDGLGLDLYAWTRRLALRIAMRALFGLDPDGPLARETDAATDFEHALGFWSRDILLQILRGPRTPWAKLQGARTRLDRLIYDEVGRRRRTGERGPDVLSLLLDATDEDGATLSDQQIRDEVMTLLFAGHDTTTSTVAFLFYELGRGPAEDERLAQELGDREPDAAELMGGTALPRLEMAMDETLRLWPAAWIGPRRSRETFEFAGVTVPGGVNVNYSSWASHRLPDVWDEPNAFHPERFAPEAKAKLPKGAYIPFGGGSRTCIGMRFGQLEIKAIATSILRRFRLELDPGYELRVRQMPTIGPKGGLPVVVRARA
jgi:cytochrome P450